MVLIFNHQNRGLAKIFRDYQEEAMKVIWEVGERGAISKEVFIRVNERLVGKTISRASIINFLNTMVEEGALDFHEATGKGGYHRVYKPKLSESSFKRYVAQTMIYSLMKDYPEETREVIRSIR